jgi:hypothetical protein
MIGRLFTALKQSCRRRGMLGTIRYAGERLAHPLLELTPQRRRERRRREEADRAFDLRHGVDTGGYIQLKQFHLTNSTWVHGSPYVAVHPDDFVRLVGALAIRHQDFSFVDFGAGKGRALLMAQNYPFKRVIGVEFSTELIEIARRNIRNYQGNAPRRVEPELVCADALDYVLPDGPGVYFFFNPFDRDIMERVAARVARSYREQPRELFVLYSNPKHDGAWLRTGCFSTYAESDGYVIYRTGP